MAQEIGYTGLAEWNGRIQEDFLKELRGVEGYKKYDEMRRNSPIVGAMLTAIEQSVRHIEFNFISEESDEDDRLVLISDAIDNMIISLKDHVSEALTMLPFGFSLFEIVYERDKSGQILWRKFAPRGQDTINQWNMDEAGELESVNQIAAPLYRIVTMPVEKLLLYRTKSERQNPEGRSVLRTAWIPYYYLTHIQQIEAIGIERDLAGLPMITLPEAANVSTDVDSDSERAKEMVRNIRNDEQAGIVLPNGWTFELVSTGGSRQFDTNAIVNRYETRILMSVLSQFIMLGQEGVGSLALSKDQTDFFVMSVNTVADNICDVLEKQAIPRLLKLNGYDPDGITVEHSPAGDVDKNAIATLLSQLGSFIHWTAEDEVWLRQLVGLPERDVEDIDGDIEEKKIQDAEAIARLKDAQEKKESEDDSEDVEDADEEDIDEEDNLSVTMFKGYPPDLAIRNSLEKKWKMAVRKMLDKQRTAVMKEARRLTK